MHVVIPTCLMSDMDDRIKLIFPERPWHSAEELARMNELILDRFPWATIEWTFGTAHLLKPNKPA